MRVLLDARFDARRDATSFLSLLLIEERAKRLLFNIVGCRRQFKLPLLSLELVHHLFLARLVLSGRLTWLRVRSRGMSVGVRRVAGTLGETVRSHAVAARLRVGPVRVEAMMHETRVSGITVRSQRVHVRRMVVGRQMWVRRVAAFARVGGRKVARRHLVESSGAIEVAKVRNLIHRSDVLVMLDVDDFGHLLTTTIARLVLCSLLLGFVDADERRLAIGLVRLFLSFKRACLVLGLLLLTVGSAGAFFSCCLTFSRVICVRFLIFGVRRLIFECGLIVTTSRDLIFLLFALSIVQEHH